PGTSTQTASTSPRSMGITGWWKSIAARCHRTEPAPLDRPAPRGPARLVRQLPGLTPVHVGRTMKLASSGTLPRGEGQENGLIYIILILIAALLVFAIMRRRRS